MVGKTSNLEELTTDQYQALIEQTSDVVTVVDVTGTIRYQSPNSERVKGWPPEDLVGENIIDLVHPEDRERVVERFTALLGAVGAIDEEIEFRFRTKAGEWIWLAVTGAAPGSGIPIDGYVTTSRDISRRKAYEQRLLEQRDDLETLNEVLRHDIRNDLQLIEAYAEMLEDHVDEAGREHLEQVQRSADNAVSLTNTARTLAEVLLRSDTDVQSVPLGETLREEFIAVRETNPEAVMHLREDVPDVDVVAGELLSSVFRNLLKNAIQHNDKETPEVTVDVDLEDDTAVVRVADNGPGISADRRDDIFGKGEKGLESEGSGIGLYLVRSLLESYDGSVRVEDNEPAGAVFVVELAVADGSADPDTDANADDEAGDVDSDSDSAVDDPGDADTTTP